MDITPITIPVSVNIAQPIISELKLKVAEDADSKESLCKSME